MVSRKKRISALRNKLIAEYVSEYSKFYWWRYRKQEDGMDPQKSWDKFQDKTKNIGVKYEKRCGKIGHRWKDKGYLPEFGSRWECEICDHIKILDKVQDQLPIYVTAWRSKPLEVRDEAFRRKTKW